jgi:predicted RNA-binding protein YlqC (UPF0109 family)
MKEAVEKIISVLVDDKESIEISEETTDRATIVKLRVAESDMGRLIGREGRTIKAIRSLLFAAGQKQGKRFVLDIVEQVRLSC